METRKIAKNGELVKVESHSYRYFPKKYKVTVNDPVNDSERSASFTTSFTIVHRIVHRLQVLLKGCEEDGTNQAHHAIYSGQWVVC